MSIILIILITLFITTCCYIFITGIKKINQTERNIYKKEGGRKNGRKNTTRV